MRADSRWRYSLRAAWPLALAGSFLQNILLLLPLPSAKIFLGFGAFVKVEPILCQWWVLDGPGSWQKQAGSRLKPGPVLEKRGQGLGHSQAMSKSVKYCFSPLAQIAIVPT